MTEEEKKSWSKWYNHESNKEAWIKAQERLAEEDESKE